MNVEQSPVIEEHDSSKTTWNQPFSKPTNTVYYFFVVTSECHSFKYGALETYQSIRFSLH